MKRILFISHDATRTGAPIQLFSIANYFKNLDSYEVNLCIMHERGGLLNEVIKKWDPFIIYKKKKSLLAFSREKKFERYIKSWKPDLVFTNTIVVGPLISILKTLEIPIISRVPEMLTTIQSYGIESYFNPIRNFSSIIISPSELSASQLVNDLGTDQDKIRIISGFVPPMRFKSQFTHKRKRSGKFKVIMVGLWGWRKGSDLFLQTAQIVKSRGIKNITFEWVGIPLNSRLRINAEYDIKMAELEDYVSLLEPTDTLEELYDDSSLIFISSREDPMPIVGLEAASRGTPILCFDKSGGMVELARKTDGFVVPYSDCNAAANRIIDLINETEEAYLRRSKMTKDIVDKNFSYEVIMEKIHHTIKEVVN